MVKEKLAYASISCRERPRKRPRLFRARPFETSVVDLTQSEDALFRDLDPKSCRYEINKATKLVAAGSIRWLKNERPQEVLRLINDFITRSGYTSLVRGETFQAIAHCGKADLHAVERNGRIIVAHVTLVDAPGRARLLFSATADRTDPEMKPIVGPLNRWLHYHELLDYKARGIAMYDFGGASSDPTSDVYAISQFKRSFGGRLITEQIVRMSPFRVVKYGAQWALMARDRWVNRATSASETPPRQ